MDLADKFATHTRPRPDGHMGWTGPVSAPKNVPVLNHRGQLRTACSIAFELGHGRRPTGYVTPTCDHPGCLAAEHLADRPMRTELRQQLAKEQGRDLSATHCGRGHPAAEHRRFWPDGKPYCGICHGLTSRAWTVANRDRKPATRSN